MFDDLEERCLQVQDFLKVGCVYSIVCTTDTYTCLVVEIKELYYHITLL